VVSVMNFSFVAITTLTSQTRMSIIIRNYHNLRFFREKRDKFIMEIAQEHRAQMEDIISGMECPEDFKCYKSGLEDLCKIVIYRDGDLVECLEQCSRLCKFSLVAMGYFCKCPLRNYIAKNFNR